MLIASANDVSQGIPPALIAAVISAIVALIVCLVTGSGNQARFVHGMIQKIIEFSMTYPYLEDDTFCDTWPNIENVERKQRYDVYCCHVFNTLQHAWTFSRGDYAEMKTLIYPDELIVRHRRWWQSEPHNKQAYLPEFFDFVAHVVSKSE
jgi:hypothetical protein